MGNDCCVERSKITDDLAKSAPKSTNVERKKTVKSGAVGFNEKSCLDCTSKLSHVKSAIGAICDSCQTDIGDTDAYRCSESCEFALC